MLRKSWYAPLPCSHPQCVSLTYLLRLNDGSFLPFPRFVDFRRHGSLLRSSATLPATAEMHDTLHEVMRSLLVNREGLRYAMVVHAGFKLRDAEVKGYLVIVLSVASLDRLIRAVEEWEQRA